MYSDLLICDWTLRVMRIAARRSGVAVTVAVVATISRAVLVTGCSRGIGRAIASRLVAADWVVYATARRPDDLATLAAEGCRTLALDVTDEASRRAAVAAVVDAEGAVGVLVNNAGFSQSGPVEVVAPADARRQFDTNFFGPARLTQLVLPGMRAQGWGKIVNISSMGGRVTFPGGGYYHATKYALEALSDALRFEVAGFGVDVVLVEPGFVRTGFSEAAAATMGDPATTGGDDPYRDFTAGLLRSTRDVYRRGFLSKLAGDADDVARVVLRAICVERPKARYPVTPSARVLRALRVGLPDRAWDRLMAGSFSAPGPPRG